MPSQKRRCLVINTKEWDKLKEIAAEEETSAGSLVRQAIYDFLASKDKNTTYDPIKDQVRR